ncbi:hydroxyisourate hydrolase [Nocardioides sambongensis]|uniref:hydroxyisourate hydrolase n=1 Tax=Nocardioides sambongensis TaxID=2589074 RepID=UPI001E5D0550|nr:hydroxyisourate hydrolase [Nocardioides sambongensis]
MSTLSTHVLDAERGRPAAGIAVAFELPDGSTTTGATDVDGRLRLESAVGVGTGAISFRTGPWFADRGRATFYPEIRVAFAIDADDEHYHVALLLSPSPTPPTEVAE